MARTSDPHAATVKAWETRGRKPQEGNASPEKSSGDWKALEAMRNQMGSGADMRNPVFILGANHAPAAINAYLAAAGATEYVGAPLPPGVKRGRRGECYSNSTRLMMHDEDYDYVEGIAYPSGSVGGMAFMHAWLVNKRTGKVVDQTWDKPEECRYYGVRYDRKKYLKHISKTKMFGVLGGDFAAATKVIAKGGL